MTIARTETDLMGLGLPAILARAFVEGPMELHGVAFLRMNGTPLVKKTTVTAMTTSATIASSAIFGGLITAQQGAAGAATYTMPTGAVFGAAYLALVGSALVAGDSIEFTINNISTVAAEDVTVAGAAGMTAAGNMTVASNAAVGDAAAATFVIVCTATDTFTFYKRA